MNLLTVKETAQLLRVSPITIRRYIAAGRLEAVRIGRGIRVHPEAVERFVVPIGSTSFESSRHHEDELVTLREAIGDIVGIGQSGGPNDVSANKYKYVAEAYSSDRE
jgi:excisionase family DNA binding protein